MRRALLPLLVALFSVPAVAGEGMYVTFDGGYAIWNKDKVRTRLSGQVGVDPVSGIDNTSLLLDRQLPDGGVGALRIGYNIAGHVALEASLAARPWNVLGDTRGAAGFAGAAVRWFPLQGLVRPNRSFDLSFLAGMDYVLTGGGGIHGPTPNDPAATAKIDNTGRGFDGIAAEFGATFELYAARWLSLGVTPRWYVVDPIRYFVNFDTRNTGGSIPIGGSGALSMYSISLSLSFHFEPQPD